MAAEYAVVAKVDPQTGPGTQKVKQDLRSISTEANSTKAAIEKAFDQQAFDKSIGNLITRLDRVADSLDKVSTTSASVAASNAKVTGSLDKVAASATRASSSTADLNNKTKEVTKSNAAQEASLRRVLQAVDAEALELKRLNELLAESKALLDAGKISQEQYARVQALGTRAANANTASIGAQRAGYQQLGFNLNDFAVQVMGGTSVLTAFSQQAGQSAGAIGLLTGSTKGFLGFIGGPWGQVIITAVSVLGLMAASTLSLKDAQEEATDKLKKDAEQTEATRQAKEKFKTTTEGVAAAIRDATAARKADIEAQKSEAERANIAAKNELKRQINIRSTTEALLAQAKAELELYSAQKFGGGPGAEIAQAVASDKVLKLTAAQIENTSLLKDAQQELLQTQGDLAVEAGKLAADPIARLNKQYDEQVRKARAAAVATGTVTNALAAQIKVIEQQRQAAIKAAQADQQAQKSGGLTGFVSPVQGGRVTSGFGPRAAPTAGASTFHRGIDIAAPVGTPVRAAASGVVIYAGKLPGLGNAIIVDHGGGTITEYGHLSQILTQKNAQVGQGQNIGAVGNTGISTGPHLDYRVKVNGRYVDPRGGRFRTDEDATSIRAANAAETAQQRAAREADQQRDFVSGVVDQAATQGLGSRAEGLQSRIDKVLADFNRRFNRAANDNEKGAITKALTDADARQTAARFDTAYVQPLERLRQLQGTTGQAREILNRQLEETAKLGRDLSPVEKQQIEDSVKLGDAYKAQADILEQIREPLDQYKQTLTALNELLKTGAINQTQYNAKVADLGQAGRNLTASLPGRDSLGRNFADTAAKEQAGADRDKALGDLYNDSTKNDPEGMKGIGTLTTDYSDKRLAVEQKYNDDLKKITDARRDVQLNAAQSTADSLLEIAEKTVGKNNAIYKAMFVADKAVAIARSILAIQTGIAQASSQPFPENLVAIASVAAATASIISNIQSVALNLADGGRVRGPGGPRSDSIQANLSDGEFVVNARDAARNPALLEAINSGKTIRQARVQAANDPGPARASRVTVHNYAGVPIETRQNMTTGDVEVIAKAAVERHAPSVIATDLAQPNSRTRKAVTRHTTARGVKT
jgi:murein DD-endopeptidase MepM/ murein hydrolase activator NlpD